LYKFWYIRRATGIRINVKLFDKPLAKQLFKFSVWVFIIGIAQRLLLNIAPTILGIFAGTVQIAVFSIGMMLEAYTWTFASALNGLFMPKVARLSLASQTREQVNELMIKVGRIQLLIVGFIITGVVIFGKSFILLWMGVEFANSYIVAICLIVPGIITLTQEIANSLLFVENEIRYRAILFLSASGVSVVTGVLLAPYYGAIGVAVGVLIALLICHVVGMNIVYYKVLKLDIIDFFRQCHLKMLFPMILAATASLILQYFHPIASWLIFAIQGTIFAIIFYALMWFLSMNDYEKSLAKQLITPIINKIR
jgi:O-antigen/teichoic acid export membrane protein